MADNTDTDNRPPISAWLGDKFGILTGGGVVTGNEPDVPIDQFLMTNAELDRARKWYADAGKTMPGPAQVNDDYIHGYGPWENDPHPLGKILPFPDRKKKGAGDELFVVALLLAVATGLYLALE